MGRVRESVDGKIPRGTWLGMEGREGCLLNWLGCTEVRRPRKRPSRQGSEKKPRESVEYKAS